MKKFEDNIKKNPNADADAVEKESEKAQETAKAVSYTHLSPPSVPSAHPSRTKGSKMTTGKDKSKVMSLRLPDRTYRRLHAYGRCV